MIIVDTALAKRSEEGQPIRVGMIGAGFMARGVALQIASSTPGMVVSAIAARNLDAARRAFDEAGQGDLVESVDSARGMASALDAGKKAITDDPMLIAEDPRIDIVLEVTGSIGFAASVVLRAIAHGKHVALMNAELDGTVGPLLKRKADAAGVVYTNVDGDQPGVMMNLYRFVKGMGVRPLMCGNIKGLHDPYRNPTTQEGFAKKWLQKPAMVTSFADGTKISLEQAIVANGCGFRVMKRAMMGPTVPAGTPLEEAIKAFPEDKLMEGPGWVDYITGAAPAPGVFVLGTIEHSMQRHYLNLYKLGEGPIYCYYTPYHLCHFEVPTTLARAVLFQDAALAPAGGPQVEVVAQAKTDLKAGATLDGLGEYTTYGVAENADVTAAEGLLPIGLAEGCVLKRDIPKDQTLTRADVTLPDGRLIDELRAEQDAAFDLVPTVA
ncbi:MAG: NAD(P)-dependent oxidoreductase [Pseudomonadota bacterium]